MNLLDILLLAVLAAVVVLALRRTIRQRKRGGCSCGCSSCSGCGGCDAAKPPQK